MKITSAICTTARSTRCRNGCEGRAHLKNQDGCLKCKQRFIREATKEKEAKKNQEEVEKGKEDEAFWNPGKGRKK
jgi:hypothetical protein